MPVQQQSLLFRFVSIDFLFIWLVLFLLSCTLKPQRQASPLTMLLVHSTCYSFYVLNKPEPQVRFPQIKPSGELLGAFWRGLRQTFSVEFSRYFYHLKTFPLSYMLGTAMEYLQERMCSIILYSIIRILLYERDVLQNVPPKCNLSILRMVHQLSFCSSTLVSYGQGYFSQPTFSGDFHSLAVLGWMTDTFIMFTTVYNSNPIEEIIWPLTFTDLAMCYINSILSSILILHQLSEHIQCSSKHVKLYNHFW